MLSVNGRSQLDDIGESLTCSLCNKLFDQPHSLPCSHSFCINSCPQCEVYTRPKDVKKSLLLDNIVQSYQRFRGYILSTEDTAVPGPSTSIYQSPDSVKQKRRDHTDYDSARSEKDAIIPDFDEHKHKRRLVVPDTFDNEAAALLLVEDDNDHAEEDEGGGAEPAAVLAEAEPASSLFCDVGALSELHCSLADDGMQSPSARVPSSGSSVEKRGRRMVVPDTYAMEECLSYDNLDPLDALLLSGDSPMIGHHDTYSTSWAKERGEDQDRETSGHAVDGEPVSMTMKKIESTDTGTPAELPSHAAEEVSSHPGDADKAMQADCEGEVEEDGGDWVELYLTQVSQSPAIRRFQGPTTPANDEDDFSTAVPDTYADNDSAALTQRHQSPTVRGNLGSEQRCIRFAAALEHDAQDYALTGRYDSLPLVTRKCTHSHSSADSHDTVTESGEAEAGSSSAHSVSRVPHTADNGTSDNSSSGGGTDSFDLLRPLSSAAANQVVTDSNSAFSGAEDRLRRVDTALDSLDPTTSDAAARTKQTESCTGGDSSFSRTHSILSAPTQQLVVSGAGGTQSKGASPLALSQMDTCALLEFEIEERKAVIQRMLQSPQYQDELNHASVLAAPQVLADGLSQEQEHWLRECCDRGLVVRPADGAFVGRGANDKNGAAGGCILLVSVADRRQGYLLAPRTLLYLKCLCLGILVVDAQWLQDSAQQANQITTITSSSSAAAGMLNPLSYEIGGSIHDTFLRGPYRSRFAPRDAEGRSFLLSTFTFLIRRSGDADGQTRPQRVALALNGGPEHYVDEGEVRWLIYMCNGTVLSEKDAGARRERPWSVTTSASGKPMTHIDLALRLRKRPCGGGTQVTASSVRHSAVSVSWLFDAISNQRVPEASPSAAVPEHYLCSL